MLGVTHSIHSLHPILTSTRPPNQGQNALLGIHIYYYSHLLLLHHHHCAEQASKE